MTLRELINEVRNRLDDSVPPYLWSDIELTSMFNEAQNELCEKAGLLRDSITTAICQISVSSGTASYTIDTRIVKLLKVKLGAAYTELTPVDPTYMDEMFPGWEDDTGTPIYFMMTDTRKIRLYPNPTANSTLYLRVTRFPSAQLTLSAETASPEIPWQYHTKLYDGVMKLAYLKDDAETLDLNKSNLYDAKWQRTINEILMSESMYYDYGMIAIPLYGSI